MVTVKRIKETFKEGLNSLLNKWVLLPTGKVVFINSIPEVVWDKNEGWVFLLEGKHDLASAIAVADDRDELIPFEEFGAEDLDWLYFNIIPDRIDEEKYEICRRILGIS
jgi:hypothetical protein